MSFKDLKKSKELIWIVALFAGILWQVGGTYNKNFRRIGVPLILALSAWIWLGFSWRLIAYFVSMLAITRLPFTFKDDSVHDHWYNWPYIWVAGYLLGLPALFYSTDALLYSLVPMFIQGILGTLSNLTFSRSYIQWKIVEGAIGIAVSVPLALIITL